MNQFTIKLRNFARICGLTRLIRAVAPNRDYEEHFHSSLMSGIREGDVVWDIGANIGFYTKLFAEAVGSGGRVFAFEPSPKAADQVQEISVNFPAVSVFNKAISNESGEAFFDVSSGEDSVTNHLVGESDGSKTVPVEIVTGDGMSEQIGVPDIIKIDVEGFEYEVIKGMEKLLLSQSLRGVYCEVHFGLLESRGLANAPIEIEQRLKEAGFKVSWCDASHITATKD